MHSHTPRRRTRQLLTVTALAGAVLLLTSGCSSDTVKRGFLPGYDDGGPVTNQTDRITHLWNGSWIAALAVGIVTWGLMLWCIAAYRKRKGDEALPVQVRYHMPLEIMYTVVPIVMVLVLFFFTDRDVTKIQDTSAPADVNISVVAKQWSWDFNYPDANVYEAGVHAQDVGGITKDDLVDGAPGTDKAFPTLWLPAGENVKFTLTSRDVAHSFWVPAFLYKEDAIPGHPNTFEFKPLREGTYAGKCAELCGEWHSSMLFNVKVVSPDEFDKHMADLKAQGNEGQLSDEYNRDENAAESAPTESETH
ncbi:cytochrome c oxidase subunit II [Luteimicrobium subarcticum]|uniref:cytochrome-c oxidase n=1 Tax=Luteimicrobium subarcticum TaxID=620910 RepID=A0A2M8WRB2_9MICO|nr:cytochrome c oxidase subunit II [Luteimicrobium subarcticum]PJI93480.1 cytochrome c oxidase subunit 2 [Luteimicrobium subarcticum]